MNIIIKAAQFAALAHAGQTRKDGKTPYMRHPERVAGRALTREDATEEKVCICLLHDVLEDTKVPLVEIVEKFGGNIALGVEALTNPSKGSKAPRAERKRIDREHLATASKEIKVIKMLDRIDNLNDLDPDARLAVVYAGESLLLVAVIGSADTDLADELRTAAHKLLRKGGSE